MRELKFRMYALDIQKMFEMDRLHLPCTTQPNPASVYMQYTGLKDRNGKDIYEGDIVKVESTLVYPFDNKIPVDPPKKSVKYYRIGWHKSGCWNKFDGMSDEHKGIVGVNQPHIWCEVVGNIYQNPELIEGETKQ